MSSSEDQRRGEDRSGDERAPGGSSDDPSTGAAVESPPAAGGSEGPRKAQRRGTGRPRQGAGTFWSWLRNTARLWGFLGFILLILVSFRSVVLPFVLAVLVTYVLSPVLNFFCNLRVRRRTLPRWVWLIVLYLLLFGLNGLFFTSFVPRVSADLKRVVREAPAFWKKARSEWMPSAATWLQKNFGGEQVSPPRPAAGAGSPSGTPAGSLAAGSQPAAAPSSTVGAAAAAATSPASAPSSAPTSAASGSPASAPSSAPASAPSRAPTSTPAAGASKTSLGGAADATRAPSALRVRRLADGSLELDMQGFELDVQQVGQQRWVVRPTRRDEQNIDTPLEMRVNRIVEGLVQSGERRLNEVLKLGQRALVGLLTAVTTFILTLMISAFLLIDTERIIGMLRTLVAPRFHQDFDNVVHLIDRGLSGAIRGQLLICVVNAILTWVGLKLFGIKYSFLLALLAGVMSLIPIFGSILSSIPIVLVAITSGETGIDLLSGALMLGWIILIHLLEANLLNPKIIGTAARIHPVIVIFAVVAGERSYGPMGALLAVPLVSAVQAVFLYVRGKVRAQDSWPAGGSGEPQQGR